MGAERILPVEWENRQGLTVRGFVHVTGPENAPWFILAHGFTGHHIGPGYLFARLSRKLAEAGFSSLRFDFAGAGDSDGRFQEMTIGSMRNDLLSSMEYVDEKFAPKKLILLGHSLGGMIASLCCNGARRPDGLALLAPVGDPKGLIRRRASGIKAGPNKNGYYENGPHEIDLPLINELNSIDPVAELVSSSFRGSLLLMQGDNDLSISVEESRRYVDAAQKAGIETVYHVLKNADHNFSSVTFFHTIFSTTTSWAKERFL
jgi:uncharacterized protein